MEGDFLPLGRRQHPEFFGRQLHHKLARPYSDPTKRANFDSLDRQGLAPLHYAVWSDDMTVVERLLESGADINVRSASEMITPLFCVVSVKMLNFLLSKDADQTILGANGDTVLLHFIKSRMHKLSMTLLSDSSQNDIPDIYKMTPFACLFRNRDKTSLKILINSGYDPTREVLKLQELIHETQSKPSRRNSLEYISRKLLDEMDQIVSNPRPLFDLCRFRIRYILKTNIRNAVLDLPLPEKVRGAVCLKDVEQNLGLVDA